MACPLSETLSIGSISGVAPFTTKPAREKGIHRQWRPRQGRDVIRLGALRWALGNIYLADTESHSVRMINRKRLAGTAGDEKGDGPKATPRCRMDRLHGIFVDAQGAIYVETPTPIAFAYCR